MNRKTSFLLRVLALGVLGVGTSNATLIDRGGGLIYDDVLNVTWLQDTEYARTSGQSSSPSMTWQDAMTWVSNLDYYDSVRDVTYSDWRLPTTINASSSYGWDLAGTTSELAYMYYVNLGYAPAIPELGIPDPTSDNYNPFINLRTRSYWSETESDFTGRSWFFHFHFGFQDVNGWDDAGVRVWGVRDGDVANLNVPEPGSLALFGAALMGLGLVRRRRLVK